MYFYCYVYVFLLLFKYVVFCIFRIMLFFCVLFVCKYVLCYCHWVSTQLQVANISYHIGQYAFACV
jgi:hypothetical protein